MLTVENRLASHISSWACFIREYPVDDMGTKFIKRVINDQLPTAERVIFKSLTPSESWRPRSRSCEIFANIKIAKRSCVVYALLP